jgi:hypothetical protein
MKFKYIIYGLLGAALLFAAVMAYLFYSNRETAYDRPVQPVLKETAAPFSGRAGKLAIFYAGDLAGNLGPCT